MNEHLENLREIRSLMNRSSKFISLSGLSGIAAGFCACFGACYAYYFIGDESIGFDVFIDKLPAFILTAILVLVSSLVLGLFFTIRQAKRQGLNYWNESSKNLLYALSVPLITGGLFCLGLIKSGLFALCFPCTLIFYGLALFSAAKFTVRDVQYVALIEIALGLCALYFRQHYLLFWTLGFGITHIVYGGLMYWKYERES